MPTSSAPAGARVRRLVATLLRLALAVGLVGLAVLPGTAADAAAAREPVTAVGVHAATTPAPTPSEPDYGPHQAPGHGQLGEVSTAGIVFIVVVAAAAISFVVTMALRHRRRTLRERREHEAS
ncbi:hypothetical protein [Cellulomonas massiliensis]|uniref:hypothetical protein n=1 Tax=Cellulomonas massiliensis TaxID=1465811 RepID=UPI000318276F|nr:hypothetical protein [Cellulomonas massiliensis]